jgi:hypothetical protein
MAKHGDRDAAPGACCAWPHDVMSEPTWHPPALPRADGTWQYVVTLAPHGSDKTTQEAHWQWDPTATYAEIAAQRAAYHRLLDRLFGGDR